MPDLGREIKKATVPRRNFKSIMDMKRAVKM